MRYLATEKHFSTICVTSQAEGANQGSPFNTSGHDSQCIIDKGMGRGDHRTPQEIGTKCGTNGVMAISPIEHFTSPNPATTIEAINLIVFIASKAILPLCQFPPNFDLSEIQPFNQLGRRVTCSQLDLLGYVSSQVFEFITLVECPPKTLIYQFVAIEK